MWKLRHEVCDRFSSSDFVECVDLRGTCQLKCLLRTTMCPLGGLYVLFSYTIFQMLQMKSRVWILRPIVCGFKEILDYCNHMRHFIRVYVHYIVYKLEIFAFENFISSFLGFFLSDKWLQTHKMSELWYFEKLKKLITTVA